MEKFNSMGLDWMLMVSVAFVGRLAIHNTERKKKENLVAHPQLLNHILARQKTKGIVMFGMCAEENNQKQSRVSAEES